jgi:hypothetical protein
MRAREFIIEGGWEDVITQKTKLNPSVVKSALRTVKSFVGEFNKYLETAGELPVDMGQPTGSSAYHNVDNPETEYGDIDLQMISPDLEGKSSGQLAGYYNKLLDEFIAGANLSYLHNTGRPAKGHPIFKIDQDTYVQVDFLWTPKRLSHWAQWRVTPMRGIKGLITGNLYSTLGEVMNMSLQQAVQMKVKDGQPVNFQKSRKVDDVVEVTKDIEHFGTDILKFIYNAVTGSLDGLVIDPELNTYPGLNIKDIQIRDLVRTVRGLANSFEANGLFGKYNLKDYRNKDEFLKSYLDHYIMKADKAGTEAKLDKASTPEELAKVQELRDKIAKGVKIVKQAFAQ